jgi:hypothetical protein
VSSDDGNGRGIFDSVAIPTAILLLAAGLAGGYLYVRHERQAGSPANQLRRIDEEAKKAGWVKRADGTWSLPDSAGTNSASSKTNKPEAR